MPVYVPKGEFGGKKYVEIKSLISPVKRLSKLNPFPVISSGFAVYSSNSESGACVCMCVCVHMCGSACWIRG